MATIDEVVNQIGNTPIFYLKFTSQLNYAEDILRGELYANTPEFFRLQEEKSGERGQGDKNELIYDMPLIGLNYMIKTQIS